MRLDPRDIRAGLDELITIDRGPDRIELVTRTRAYIIQLEGDLRRAGFTEYTDIPDKEIHE